ncbi:beta-galactosidase [Secundilactobacillus hailunensis]|uniref:Beta-galactosidase n=1 Tax=Secundilactobacillus hailunensis TaxID=2559923 RepID=A0ABW1T5M3_9LACO|nr:beta-galactosidase [Secundilactobacillus hailunensis]
MQLKNEILYGTAYYYEYLPYDRLNEDIKMMKDANVNVVRIGESTWSTYEYQDGKFDFSKLDKVLDAMYAANIHVIVGTPTYAIPAWLAKEYPEVMVENNGVRTLYGERQKMDISSPVFRTYAERIIRKMIGHVCNHPGIIGYQIDNETHHYGTSSENVQKAFQNYLRNKFNGDLNKLNHEYGLSYWSNEINSWDDFPSVNGSINGSLNAEFEKFQRNLVTEYLKWQYDLVSEYKKNDQFITHNLDFGWKGYSYGVRAEADHFDIDDNLDYVGIDVYHPARTLLTGAEASFAGDEARTGKNKSYLVIETQAQAYRHQVPYPGQLRLNAYSHIASGAQMVEYWHWHSIHNSYETYWKGILSHDFKPNPVYYEVAKTGKELKKLSPEISNLKINSEVAFLVSNQSLTGVDQFPFSDKRDYNDVYRALYDEFYKLNVRTDITDEKHIQLNKYKLIVVPMLYAASDEFLKQLNEYVKNGGNIIYTFRSGFAKDDLKVRTTVQPGIITEACGVHYEMFVNPEQDDCKLAPVSSELKDVTDLQLHDWIELLIPDSAKVLAKYSDPNWSKYAAITQNKFGKGSTMYIGCFPSSEVLHKIIQSYVDKIQITRPSEKFPIIVKNAINSAGDTIEFYLNFSSTSQKIKNIEGDVELISGQNISSQHELSLAAWDVAIVKKIS